MENTLIQQYLLERLSFTEKQSYLNLLIQKQIQSISEFTPEEQITRQHFQRNFIYRGKDVDEPDYEYALDKLTSLSVTPVGYYLYDSEQFVYFLYDSVSQKMQQVNRNSELYQTLAQYLQYYKTTPGYNLRYKDFSYYWGYIYVSPKKVYQLKLVDSPTNKRLPGFRVSGHKNCDSEGSKNA